MSYILDFDNFDVYSGSTAKWLHAWEESDEMKNETAGKLGEAKISYSLYGNDYC